LREARNSARESTRGVVRWQCLEERESTRGTPAESWLSRQTSQRSGRTAPCSARASLDSAVFHVLGEVSLPAQLPSRRPHFHSSFVSARRIFHCVPTCPVSTINHNSYKLLSIYIYIYIYIYVCDTDSGNLSQDVKNSRIQTRANSGNSPSRNKRRMKVGSAAGQLGRQ
jgi:hypothetical protein